MGESSVSEFIDAIASRVVDYINSDGSDGSKTINYIEHDSRKKTTDLSLPLTGNGSDSVLNDIDEYLRQSVKTNRAEFMNPLWGGLNVSAFAAEVVAALTNQSMYTYELSPIATLIEREIISRMSEIVGFSDGFGTFTTGGSNGNMLGMLCARQFIEPNSSQLGFNGQKYVAFVSEEAHYSVMMSANVVGIGHQNLIKVPCDSDGKMKPESLLEEIDWAKSNGMIPFCIIATSGTTVRGSFDPIREIAQIANDQNIWLHVDAAWGGSCLFSGSLRRLMDGIEMADSVCWDAHKMMGLPLICSAFIIKNPQILKNICKHTESAHYLFHGDSKEQDLGHYSLQCGRRNDSLKLWISWRELGDSGWAKLVESYCRLAGYFEQKIDETSELELMSSREWTNVCFRFNPGHLDDDALNKLNSELRARLMKDGKFLVSRSNIGQNVVIRAVISNPGITEQIIDSLMEVILSHGKEILASIPAKH